MPLRGHVDVLRLFASIGDYPDNDLTNVASRELEGDPDAATSSRIGSSSNNRSASAKQVEGLDGDLARSQSSPTKILKLPMGSVAVPVLPLKEDQTHHSQSQIESKLSEDCQVPDSDETQRLGEYRQRSKDILPGGHWNVDSLRLADKIIQDRKSTQSYALGMPDFSLETGGQNTGDQVAVESNQASEDVSEADVGTATVVRYTPYKRKKTLSPKTSAFLQDRLADISLEAPKSTDSSDIKASVDISSLVEHAVLTQAVYGDCSVSLSAEGGGRSTGRYQGPFGDANVNKASTSETGLGKAWKSFSLGPEGYAVDRSNTSSESASVVNETIRAGDRLNDTAPDSNRCSRKGDKIFESYQSTDSPKAREGTQHPVEPELTFRSGSIGRGVSELPFQGATREFSGKTSHQNSVNNQHSLSPDLTSEHSISYIPHIPHTTTNSIGSTSTTTSVLKHNTSSRNSIQSRQVDAGGEVQSSFHVQVK